MDRAQWLEHYREVRKPVIGENLFPRGERAEIALLMLRLETKQARKEARETRYRPRED